MMHLISILVLYVLTVLNLNARVNDAIHISALQPGAVLTNLLRQGRLWVKTFVGATAMLSTTYVLRREFYLEWLLLVGISIIMIIAIGIFIIVMEQMAAIPALRQLISDKIAGDIANRIGVNSATGILIVRITAAMTKVFIFYVALIKTIS